MKESDKENGIAVVLLSQMNKGGEGMDAIRDSGEISQIADTVLELSPIDEFANLDGLRANNLKFHKNRNGRLGTSPAVFNGAYQKFTA